jgi:hypothetical protein
MIDKEYDAALISTTSRLTKRGRELVYDGKYNISSAEHK